MRKAKIIDEIEDEHGETWDVREYRPTSHGWPVALGWKQGVKRGMGGSNGIKVVPTAPLMRYLKRLRGKPGDIELPLSRQAIKRLRREMGFNWYEDNLAWWESRLEDLASLTLAEFAVKHGCEESAAANARLAFLGRSLRPAGWWREPEVAQDLLTLPTDQAARKYNLRRQSIYRYRTYLRQQKED